MLVYAKNINIAEFNGVILDEDRKSEYDEVDEKGIFKYEPLMYSRFVEEKLEKARDKYFYPIYVSQDLKEITLEKKKGYFEVLPINNKREICWKVQKEKFKELLSNNRSEYSAIKDKKGNVQIFEKYREEDGTKIKTHWIGKRYNATTSGTGVLKELLGEKIFSYPKSLYAVLDTLKIMTNTGDVILDFFAGSGTTGHAVLELNEEGKGGRKFILVEQLESHIDVCIKRIKEVLRNTKSQNNFVYMELAKWNEGWVEKIEKAKAGKKLAKLWDDMKEIAFLSYKVDPKTVDANAKDFADLSIADQKKFLIECLDKNQLYVNLSEIEDKEYGISKEDMELNNNFYGSK
jgi:adenine-specific DNA-methyltransferase